MHRRTMLVAGITLIGAGCLGVAMVLTFGLSVGATSGGVGGLGVPATMMAGSVDSMFIEEMIPHHDDAIAMAELAITRAEHPEIRELARDIKRNQTAENAQMRTWYGEWFGVDVPESSGNRGFMGRMMGGGVVDMSDLAEAESFDKAFIEQMIPHHQMGIMMSQMAGGGSNRQEIRDLTDSIIKAQSSEISSMREWYSDWYGR